ncbi:hypothetical protein M011DRAFT_459574 [Sporormia fimetaria CBS 119925]|uniref:Uncharacterized protein n=1 Tax=Sporormia fimetaria CBS 119925 TaxID=1340428 RepID=A0A6A6V942_9PLEO|nr:hypothetical protein M011DRAFT_459574 [Sporormia fimetaria CBS 119925]
MSPPFVFKIDEIRENPDIRPREDSRGRWIPSTDPGSNQRISGGVSNRYYHCDRQRICQISPRPKGSRTFKTFSVYYSAGQGFWVLRGDATKPEDDGWHPLRFNHSTTDYASFLTNAGQHDTLCVQRRDQQWPRMLLPDVYHTNMVTESQQYGGLVGELPILLALVAFSTSRDWLENVLPLVFKDGGWQIHSYKVPRMDKRGVVVTVYTCPSTLAGGSTKTDLEQYEHGCFGKYYY